MDLTLPSYQKNSSAVLSKIEVALAWSFYIAGTKRMSRPIGAKKHSAHLCNTKYSKFIGVCDAAVDKVQKKPPKDIPQGIVDALTDYRTSPLMADNMTGLPKTLIITAEFDVLRDDGLLYKKRLEEAGVPVTHHEYKSFHGFLLLRGDKKICASAKENIIKFLKEL